MKKLLLLVLLAFVLIIPKPCPAADRACQPIWDNVAGQTYDLATIDGDWIVVFSESYAGPCPQGILTIFDGGEVLATCKYMSKLDNAIMVTCGNTELLFGLFGDYLIWVNRDSILMQLRMDE